MTPRFRSLVLMAAAGALLSLAAATACHHSPDRSVVPPKENPLAGSWNVTSATTTDTCNLGFDIPPISGPLAISGSAASFTIAPACCRNAPFGTGTIDGSDVTIETKREVLTTCTLQIDEVDNGTTDELGFSGSADLKVTASGDCGPGFPCEVRGSFSAVRCPSIGQCGAPC